MDSGTKLHSNSGCAIHYMWDLGTLKKNSLLNVSPIKYRLQEYLTDNAVVRTK